MEFTMTDWGLGRVWEARMFWAAMGCWLSVLIFSIASDAGEKKVVAWSAFVSMLIALQIGAYDDIQ